MKTKNIIILLAFMLIGMIGYSQTVVTVKNLIDTKYDITAVYSDGNGNILSQGHHLDKVSLSNNTVTLPYTINGYPGYSLDHWKIVAHDCTPVLDAEHEYGTDDTDYITHCHQCSSGNAISNYNASTHLDIVGCR